MENLIARNVCECSSRTQCSLDSMNSRIHREATDRRLLIGLTYDLKPTGGIMDEHEFFRTTAVGAGVISVALLIVIIVLLIVILQEPEAELIHVGEMPCVTYRNNMDCNWEMWER